MFNLQIKIAASDNVIWTLPFDSPLMLFENCLKECVSKISILGRKEKRLFQNSSP